MPGTHRFRPVILLLAVASFCVLAWPRSAAASPVTYTYMGNSFTQFSGVACPPDCSVSGSFTVSSALPANFSGDVGPSPSLCPLGCTYIPAAFSFTDGDLSISSGDALTGNSAFFVETNGSGQIVQWSIWLQLDDGVVVSTSNYGASFIGDSTVAGLCASLSCETASNSNNPGTWASSSATDPDPTPEPSSLLLLGTGLLGLLAVTSFGPFIRRCSHS